MTQASRDEFWDTSKAVLMYLVVLGHAIQIIVGEGFFSHPLFKAIYLFHLPVFFLSVVILPIRAFSSGAGVPLAGLHCGC